MGEKSSKWRVLNLVSDEFLLGCERQRLEVFGAFDLRELNPSLSRFFPIEPVAGYPIDQRAETLVLQLAQFRSSHCLNRLIVEVCSVCHSSPQTDKSPARYGINVKATIAAGSVRRTRRPSVTEVLP